jgi:hypothetical protein
MALYICAQVCLNIFCHQAHLKLNICIKPYNRFHHHLQETGLSNHQNQSQRIFLKFLPEYADILSNSLDLIQASISALFIKSLNSLAEANCIKSFHLMAFTNAIFLKFLANIQSIKLFALSLYGSSHLIAFDTQLGSEENFVSTLAYILR